MTVPSGVRGHRHTPVDPADAPQPAHVWCHELGPLVPLRSNDVDQWIAKTGMILRVTTGSTVYGTAEPDGEPDIDEMGICVEPPRTVIGSGEFKHYRYRTAEPDGPAGPISARSGPGDLDLTVYGVRRFVQLAWQGNPSLLVALFAPDDAVRFVNELGQELRERAPMFASRAAARRFMGYMRTQREDVERPQACRRDLIARHGYDTKAAMHLLRVGIQGFEYLTAGRITLPVPEPDRSYLLRVRQGLVPLPEIYERADRLTAALTRIAETSDLPDRPDRTALDRWVVNVHRKHWAW